MLPFGNMASDKFRRKAQICRRLQQYSFLKPKSHEIAQPVQCPFIPMLNAVKDIGVPFSLRQQQRGGGLFISTE